MKRYAIETAILLVAATLCAVVANAMASRERRLALVGSYGTTSRAAMAPDWVATREGGQVPAAVTDPALVDLAPITTDTAVEAPPAAEPTESATVAGTTTAAAAPPSASTGQQPTAAAPAPSQPAAPAKASRAEILERFPPAPEKPYVEISGADAAWLHGQGALFLDARRSSIFEQGHIAGAKSFSVWESDVDDKVAGLLNEVSDQKLPIVIYCSGGACEDSHMLSQKLWGVFFENVLVYKDGFPDWQQRGGPVRTGAAQ